MKMELLSGFPGNFSLPTISRYEPKEPIVESSSCGECGGSMRPLDVGSYACRECGLIRECPAFSDEYTPEMAGMYNSPSASSVALRIVGKGTDAHLQDRKFIMLTSDYKKVQERNTLQRLQTWTYNNQDTNIAFHILQEAATMYNKLQKNGVVKRADGYNGLLAACLAQACAAAGIPKKPKVIADLAGITDSQLSEGDRLLRQYAREGVLELQAVKDQHDQFIDQYWEALGLSEAKTRDGVPLDEFRGFAGDLVRATEMRQIRDPRNSSRPTTRCAGALWILIRQVGAGVSIEAIERECQISKSTFNRYVDLVAEYVKRPAVREVFDKYRVPV